MTPSEYAGALVASKRVPNGVERVEKPPGPGWKATGKKGRLMDNLTKSEKEELDMLRAEVEKTTDPRELRELSEEIIECIRGITYRQALAALRKEYDLPSPEAEVRQLVDQIYVLERNAQMARSRMGSPVKPDTYGVW